MLPKDAVFRDSEALEDVSIARMSTMIVTCTAVPAVTWGTSGEEVFREVIAVSVPNVRGRAEVSSRHYAG